MAFVLQKEVSIYESVTEVGRKLACAGYCPPRFQIMLWHGHSILILPFAFCCVCTIKQVIDQLG